MFSRSTRGQYLRKCHYLVGWNEMQQRVTFDAAAAHPEAAGVGFQRGLAGKLVTCQVAEQKTTWKQV